MSPLPQILRAQLAATPAGRLPFVQIMELALYHPEHGYYGAGLRRIGRQGDFFTSVSVGPLFGKLLAMRAIQEWKEQDEPENFTIIEQGAHDGQLAEDVLSALEGKSMRYLIVEPNPKYREVQTKRLGDRVQWVDNLAALQTGPKHAFFLCNELPDAFPVHLVRWNGERWRELFVEADGTEAFRFVAGDFSCDELAEEAKHLPHDLETGHTLEINLAMLTWIRELAHAAFRGAIFIADYGLDAEEFFADSRASGTIRRYWQHHMDGHVLEDLGACDLTTHINFTRLVDEATRHGMKQREYDLQGRVLGRMGLTWMESLQGKVPDRATAALIRQFNSLTHPAIMGRSFRCLILDKPSAP
ncbi:SAM-dependent methyltransferase [Prosthecobacter sp.]|uniref:class I SAM-dependent methyltransferase n=1 Tax=Prosthecobacter sp. TaxID=1965333 RepID=UPI002ABB16CE|nr:SAM-dependent methyltransferase [Prosthecobacter sp.]MDZ4403093.1 SAM-dependent methyltransferase [Prosthecobacter sp.]